MTLIEWMQQEKKSVSEVAKILSVTVPCVYRYIKTNRVPTPEIMRKIIAMTGGKVTANDFYN